MKTCKKCLFDENHPLGFALDKDGICFGCKVHSEKTRLDWKQRFEKLKTIVNEFRGKSEYDCIVPICGSKDSFYVLHVVVNLLKLRPLCVIYNSTHMSRVGHKNLGILKKAFNVDTQMYLPSELMVKEIMKSTLMRMGSIYWHVHCGTQTYAVQQAIKWKTPLIIWGCHEAVDQVGMFSHLDEVEMSRRYRDDFHLMGFNMERLEKLEPQLSKFNLDVYRYPSYSSLNEYKVRGIYLSNYVPWNQRLQYELVKRKYGFRTYNSVELLNGEENCGCVFYGGMHDYLRRLKCGYSRDRVHLVREIRWNRISKEKAVILENNKLENWIPDEKIINIFSDYLGAQPNAIKTLLKTFANPQFWQVNHNSYSKKNCLSQEINYKYKFKPVNDFKIEYSKPQVLSPGLPYK